MDKKMYNGSYRKQLGHSQRAFAEQVGVTHATVARWEKGKAKPSNLAIEKLLELTAKSQAPSFVHLNYRGISCSPPIRVEPDSGLYSAYCDQLGVASCGATPKEAVEDLQLAAGAYFKALDKRGLLERRLKEKKVKFTKVSDLLTLTKGIAQKGGSEDEQ